MPAGERQPIRVINSRAPIRICDNGGWTDTWFAQHGRVLNIAVSPYVEVRLSVFGEDGYEKPITIHAQNFDDHYSIGQPNGNYGRHPLIEAAFDCIPVPEGQTVELSIYSAAPAGCSTGTSAALAVAVLGALDVLTSGHRDAYAIAAAAHRVETEFLHLECGIQDQIAAAFGGINLIDMYEYPHAKVGRLQLPRATERELEARLALVYVGLSHSSSQVHEMVIRHLENAGPNGPQLERLRAIACRSSEALCAADFAAFGRSMIENTEAQRDLHPALIGTAHQQVIDIAREFRALGWKVNGAGGDGGSITLLGGEDRGAQQQMLHAIEAANPSFCKVPICLSASGLRVWDSPPR